MKPLRQIHIDPSDAGALSAHPDSLLQAELARVVSSPSFRNSPRHRRFLEYLVAHALRDDGTHLKEMTVGIDVFDRHASNFDPQRNTIVRVEARRLRARLARHYRTDGADSPVEITMPLGHYTPMLRRRASAANDAAARARAQTGLVDERARDLVDRGRYHLRDGNVEGYMQALQRFRAAVEIAPRYAAAHFGIARALSQIVGMTLIAPIDGVEEAKRAAIAALALDPLHAEAASLLAAIRQRYDYDWPAAQTGYLAAIAIAPNSLYVHFNYAFGLMLSGRLDEAEAEMQLARELDPLDVGLRAMHALVHVYRRDYARAEAMLSSVIDGEPRHLLAHSLLAALHLYRSDAESALAEYRLAKEIAPHVSIGAVGIAQAHAMACRRAEAVAERKALIDAFEGRYLSPYQLALIALRLDDRDDALAELARAAHERDPNFICVLMDPAFDGLRDDERYVALMHDCGLDRAENFNATHSPPSNA